VPVMVKFESEAIRRAYQLHRCLHLPKKKTGSSSLKIYFFFFLLKIWSTQKQWSAHRRAIVDLQQLVLFNWSLGPTFLALHLLKTLQIEMTTPCF
jgi:hypothetical protein